MANLELQRIYANQLRLRERSLDELESLARMYEQEYISTEGISPLVDYPLIVYQIRLEIACREMFGQ